MSLSADHQHESNAGKRLPCDMKVPFIAGFKAGPSHSGLVPHLRPSLFAQLCGICRNLFHPLTSRSKNAFELQSLHSGRVAGVLLAHGCDFFFASSPTDPIWSKHKLLTVKTLGVLTQESLRTASCHPLFWPDPGFRKTLAWFYHPSLS